MHHEQPKPPTGHSVIQRFDVHLRRAHCSILESSLDHTLRSPQRRTPIPVCRCGLATSVCSRTDSSKLVHRCTPAESLVYMVENIGGICFTHIPEVRGDFSAQAHSSAHHASPRMIRFARRASPCTVLERRVVGTVRPGTYRGCQPTAANRDGSSPLG